MSGSSSAVGSLLEKPLSELTEEDIAQLTREDCRRFLKLKGMRRPSWNKSQAIQQVISLKALLDCRPDPKNLLVQPHPHPTTPPVSVPSTTPVAEDPSPYRRRDPNPKPNPIASHALLTCASLAYHAADVQREGPTQMTIFYGDNVNVYNEVPVDRARAIMRLAANPIDLNEPPTGPVLPSSTVHSQIHPAGASPIGPPDRTRAWESEDSLEGFIDCPTGRRASLQRYREKRKDRYKVKRVSGGSPSGLEMMFLSQNFRSQNPNEQSSMSNTSFPTQLRASCTPPMCSSIENRAQKCRISIDLNVDGTIGNGKRVGSSSDWFVDSGATCHVTKDKEVLINPKPSSEIVTVANEDSERVALDGKLDLPLTSGSFE